MDTEKASTEIPMFWRAGAGMLLITLGIIIIIAWAGPAAQEPNTEMVPVTGSAPSGDPNGLGGTKQTDETGRNYAFGEPLPKGVLPTQLGEAPLQVRDAYGFATDASNRELMQSLTCYCGCSAGLDHASLYNCYVEEVLPEGLIAYSGHGIGCTTCINEVRDAETWQREGTNPQEIQGLIDTKYGP